jgi:hypothetical protein
MLLIVALPSVANMNYDSSDRITRQLRIADAGSPPDSRAAVVPPLRARASDAPPSMAADDKVAPFAAAVAAARAAERGFWICY